MSSALVGRTLKRLGWTLLEADPHMGWWATGPQGQYVGAETPEALLAMVINR